MRTIPILVPRMLLSRVHIRIRLDSRFKRAGMTDLDAATEVLDNDGLTETLHHSTTPLFQPLVRVSR
jgi:hypothetical protein